MNGAAPDLGRKEHKRFLESLAPSEEGTEPALGVFDEDQAGAGNAAVSRAPAAALRERSARAQALQKAYGNAAVGQAALQGAGSTPPVTAEGLPAEEPASTLSKAEPETEPRFEEMEPRAGESESAPRAEGQEKKAPARAKDETAPPAPEGPPGTPGMPTLPPTAAVRVSGSTPRDVLASLATVPPSQFARGIGEAEAASQAALANQAQASRAEIPEVKTRTGLPAAGAEGARPASTTAVAVAEAAAGPSAESRAAKPETGKQEVQTPVVQSQRPPEPTHLPGPEEPTGDPKADAAMAQDAQSALETVTVDDRGIPQDAGTPKPIKLDREADPALMDQESRDRARDVDRATQAERLETERDFGEGAIAPRPDDSMIATKVGIQGRPMAKLKGGPAGPSDAELAAGFDASLGPVLNSRVQEKATDYESEEQRFEADKQAAHEHTRAEIAALEDDTARKQVGRKLEAQEEVAAQREQWRKEIGDHQAKYEKSAEGAVADTRGKVAHEKQEGERKIAGHYAEANQKIAKEHGDAKVKEEEARKKAKKKSSGFFGWVRRKAAALIDWLKDAVNFIYDNVRKAVKAAINFVKDAVLKVIDLVRDAVVGLIKGLAAGLKLLVNIALIAFPETRRRINAKIDAGVQVATKFVNDAADTLKKGVAAALDFLASAIDKLLGLIQSIYSGILTFVSMVISGEFEEIIRRLVYLVSAAKTVPDVFEQAALEELLGANLDEPLSLPELQFAAANNLLPATPAAGPATPAVGEDHIPKPPYSEENVGVDDVDHDFELSPEMEAELLSELEGDEGGTVEIGAAEDESRSIAAILAEAKGEAPESAAQGAGQETQQEAAPAVSDGLTPMQRAKVKWEMMKDGIAKWWSDNWGKVLLAAAAAIVGFIALNIVTGGGVTAVFAALMPILTPLFIGVTVVTLASHAKDYVEKGWEGQIRPAGKALAHGLAAGAIELISWLTFKAGSAALRGAKAVAKGGLKLAQAGARGAQRLGMTALRAAKAVIARGRIILQGLGKTRIGKMFTRLSQLGDDLLKRLRFRKFRIVLQGRRFRLEGFINPWILLANGELEKIPNPKDASGKITRLRKGERLPDPSSGVEGVVIGAKEAKRLKYRPTAAKAAAYGEKILEGNSTLLASRLKTPAGQQAHHLIASSEAGGHKAAEMAAKNGWDLNHAKNGLNIPDKPNKLFTTETPPRSIWHHGGHTGDYYAAVAKELDTVWNTFVAKGRPKGFDWIGEMNKASARIKDGIMSGKIRLYTE